MMLSQPRVWLAMARDGLFPESFFGAIHEKYRTPWKATILTGVAVAIGAAFLPLRVLADLTNIGTLFAFVMVCIAVIIMRIKHPEAERPFRAPGGMLTPVLGIITCLILMFSLAAHNWWRLFGWLAIGFVIYFTYSRKHSVLAKLRAAGKA
jgi:APA family basic amino acid/polyamine antiporter